MCLVSMKLLSDIKLYTVGASDDISLPAYTCITLNRAVQLTTCVMAIFVGTEIPSVRYGLTIRLVMVPQAKLYSHFLSFTAIQLLLQFSQIQVSIRCALNHCQEANSYFIIKLWRLVRVCPPVWYLFSVNNYPQPILHYGICENASFFMRCIWKRP